MYRNAENAMPITLPIHYQINWQSSISDYVSIFFQIFRQMLAIYGNIFMAMMHVFVHLNFFFAKRILNR